MQFTRECVEIVTKKALLRKITRKKSDLAAGDAASHSGHLVLALDYAAVCGNYRSYISSTQS